MKRDEAHFGKSPFDAQYFESRRPNLYNRLFGLKGFVTRWLRREIRRDSALLDVGCGTGLYLAEVDWIESRFGCDVSQHALSAAASRVPSATFAQVDSNGTLPFEERKFDAIAAFDVIEHVEDDVYFAAQLRARLKPRGVVVLSTPNPLSIGRRLKGDNWFGYQDHTHINIQEPHHFIKLFERSGFEILFARYDGLWDVPYFPLLALIERVVIQLPSVLAFNFAPFRSSWLGENLWLIARATDEHTAFSGERNK